MTRKRLVFMYNHLEEIILVSLFTVMVASIFIQVFMRYVINDSLTWSEELGRFTFEWLTWIGISIGAREGEHIKITMLVDKFPFKLAQAANILSDIIVIIICGLTIFYGIQLSDMFAGSNFTTIKISLSWGYWAVITGCGLMTIRSLVSIAKSFNCIRKNQQAVITEEGGAE